MISSLDQKLDAKIDVKINEVNSKIEEGFKQLKDLINEKTISGQEWLSPSNHFN